MLFKFCKLTRRNNKTDHGHQQEKQEHESFVCRIAHMMRHRRSKSVSSDSKNNVIKMSAPTLPAMIDADTISNCSSIELVRQLQSRASSSLLGQFAVASSFATTSQQSHQQNQAPSSILLSMCDNINNNTAQDVPTEAAPALAMMSSNFDNFINETDFDERLLAERRLNYARRNVGAMRRNSSKTVKKQENEWMFKLYDLPGSDIEKQNFSEVAKSIRKTLVSSLTPLLVETTSQLRQIASVPQNSNQHSGDGSSTAPAALHLHITMKPEVVAPSQQSGGAVSPQQDSGNVECSVSPSSNNNTNQVDAFCVVRVSATISSNTEAITPVSTSPAAVVPSHDEAVVSPDPTTGVDTMQNNTSSDDKPYLKSLQHIDDIMLQSLPAELFDDRVLMRRDRHLRRHHNQKLVDSAVQTAVPTEISSNMLVPSVEEPDSPVFYQQQILMRHERRHQGQHQTKPQPQMGKSAHHRSFTAANHHQTGANRNNQSQPVNGADLRRARVVPLNQPATHFYHYEQDDLFSETSVIGTYEERACSIAKCLNWMSKLSEDEVLTTSGGAGNHQHRNHHQHPRHHRQHLENSPVVALGAGEALAVPPPCHVYEYRHIHTHNHFVARI